MGSPQPRAPLKASGAKRILIGKSYLRGAGQASKRSEVVGQKAAPGMAVSLVTDLVR